MRCTAVHTNPAHSCPHVHNKQVASECVPSRISWLSLLGHNGCLLICACSHRHSFLQGKPHELPLQPRLEAQQGRSMAPYDTSHRPFNPA